MFKRYWFFYFYCFFGSFGFFFLVVLRGNGGKLRGDDLFILQDVLFLLFFREFFIFFVVKVDFVFQLYRWEIEVWGGWIGSRRRGEKNYYVVMFLVILCIDLFFLVQSVEREGIWCLREIGIRRIGVVWLNVGFEVQCLGIGEMDVESFCLVGKFMYGSI